METSEKTIAPDLISAFVEPSAGPEHALSAAWAPSTYDAVICTQDRFGQSDGGDRFRGKVMDLQGAVDQSVREACTDAGVRMFDLPTGLNTAGRVRWVADAVREHGLLRTT